MFAAGVHSFAMYMGYNYMTNGEAPPTGLDGTWCAEGNDVQYKDDGMGGKVVSNQTYHLCMDYDKGAWRREDATPAGTRI